MADFTRRQIYILFYAYGHHVTCLAIRVRHICPIKSLNGRRRIRQMLSFPGDRVVGITPILGRPTRRRHISGRQLLIFTTYVRRGGRVVPGRNYISPLRNCGLCCRCARLRFLASPMSSAAVPRSTPRNAAEVGARTSSVLLWLKFFCVSNERIRMQSEGS